MPNVRKIIKDIVYAPFDKYDKWQSNLEKQSQVQDKVRFARESNIRSAEEDERRKRGDLSGSPTIGKALMNIMNEGDKRKANIQSAQQHEENKARGTSSSAVRTIIK